MMLRHYLSTTKHKAWVLTYILAFCAKLIWRGIVHDLSKYRDPEASRFAEVLPELEDTTYGSEEYDELLDRLEPALVHHYAMNRHHPEHFEHEDMKPPPIRAMHLLDVTEMFIDWRAATRRHKDGDIAKSVQVNAERYGFEDDALKTVLYMEAWRVRDGYEYTPPKE